MPIDVGPVLDHLVDAADPWWSWRAARLRGGAVPEPPHPPAQDELGGFLGPSGRSSPGSTGEALCHLAILGARASGPATIAADWLEDSRTPAGAWLDPPGEVPGELDDNAGARVWATAAAASGLLAVGRTPGDRCMMLLRAETDQSGRFTGGAYPTFAGAAAFWALEGPKTEIAEWALRWAREMDDDWWGPWERATALTFWAAAGIGYEHLSVEMFLETLRAGAPEQGWKDDPGLTLRTIELLAHYGVA